jgi:sortase A
VVLGVALTGWALANIPTQSVASDRTALRQVRSFVSTGSVAPDTARFRQPLYPVRPTKGQALGTLSIPALKQVFPVIQGTGTAELRKGVGHMTETALPGEADNCVLSGHRDTVFTRLGQLKKGDTLVVETAAGIFTYRIGRIRIVGKDDRTVVVPADHAVLTVSTCYPFNYVGAAPKRYVLSADLVTSQ